MVKNLIRNHWTLYEYGMMKGDSVSISIWIDLSRAIRTNGVLTFKQKRYLILWADGWTLYDIGVEYQRGKDVIKRVIDIGIKNICLYLNKNTTYVPQLVYVRGSNFKQSRGENI